MATFPNFDEINFEAEVLARPGLTVVDFWNEGCVPCKQLERMLVDLAPELPSTVRIGKVDAASNPNLAARYEVRGVPALLLFKDGTLVERRDGVDRRQVLKKAITTHA